MTTDAGPGAVREAPLSARRERTRERLLDAAYDVFSAQGIHGASIEAVCEAAGFTRGAFYSNFESKEELFLALADREVRTRITSLEGAIVHLPVHPVRDGVLVTDAVAVILAAVMADSDDERRWHLMSAELELLALRDPQVAARYVAQQERFCAELSTLLVRVLDGLGMRFAVTPADGTRLLVSTYGAAARAAYLSTPDGEHAARALRESSWLPALVGRLVEPAEDDEALAG